VTWLPRLPHDLRFAVRTLRRRRLLTAVATATIALGIGAATSIYSVVDGVLLRPLPFREPGRLVAVWLTFPDWKKEPILARMWDRIPLSIPEFRDLRDGARSFESVGIWTTSRALLVEEGRAEMLPTVRASASLLHVLGERPLLGRMFLPGEDVPNAPGAALVSYETWQSRYGGDPHVLGRVVHFEEQPYTIVGVLPRGLTLGRTTATESERPAFWVPVGQSDKEDYVERSNHSYFAVARLKPGVSPERGAQEARSFLVDAAQRGKRDTRVAEWQYDQTRDARAPMLVLLAAVGLLLLVACANVATLLLGEAAAREHEMAARRALGAPRRRIVRQLLVESVTLAALGGPAGAALAYGGTRALVALAPPKLPGLAAVHMDLRVLAFALAVVVATGVLFGLAPALTLSRATPGAVLRGGAGQSARGRGALQRTFVAAELALAAVLLVGAGLLARSFERVTRVDPGFRTDRLLVVRTRTPQALRRDTARLRQIYDDAAARLAALPGVTAATTTTMAPFAAGSSSSTLAVDGESGDAAAAGAKPPEGAQRHEAQQRTVAPGYFAALGIPLLAGRDFRADDRGGATDVAVVSEALARRDFRAGSPLGRRVYFQGKWRTVVGVVGDVHDERLTRDAQPTIYTPFAQRDNWTRAFLVRTATDPAALAPAVRRALPAVDARLSVANVDEMDELLRRSFAEERYRAALVSLFGVLSVVLAAVGMYGVTARAVAGRARETGIRLALGATAWTVARSLAGFTLAGVALGVALGLLAGAAAARALAPFLFGVTPGDPATFASVLALLATVSVVASLIPARRAGRIEVMRVLRGE
jgi:predicted permease